MGGLEDRQTIPDVGPRHQSQPSHQPGSQVAQYVPVEIGQHQHIELLRADDHLHGAVVHDYLPVLYLRISVGHAPAAPQEEPVALLHDVGLVHRLHLPASVLDRVVEGEVGDAVRGLLGDYLQALGNPRSDILLQPRVHVLGVLAEYDHVYIGELVADSEARVDRANVGIEVELLAEGHVHAAEPFADGRGHRSLQGHLDLPYRVENVVRQGRAEPLHGRVPGLDLHPFYFRSAGFEDLHGGGDHLGPDAVAGDNDYPVLHRQVSWRKGAFYLFR